MKPKFMSIFKGRTKAVPVEEDFQFRKPALETLFKGRSALAHGLAGQLGACGIAFSNTGDRNYLYWMGVAVAVFLGRQLHFRHYDKIASHLQSDRSTPEEIDRCYRGYMVASSTTSLIVGLLSGYSIYFHPGTWATAIPLALTLGTMVAAVGRNYGNSNNVTAIVLCSFIPSIIAFLGYAFYSGDFAVGLGGAICLLPFMAATRSMAAAVRGSLAAHVESRNDAERLKNSAQAVKDLLDNAVSNMPNGLLMLDPDGVITFSNNVAKTMFGVPDDTELVGRPIESLLILGNHRGLGEAKAVSFRERIFKLFDGTSHTEVLRVSDDFQVEFTVRQESRATSPRGQGDGFVVVCEDVTTRVLQQEKIRKAANIDGLSDIPNRSHMRELVEEARSAKGKGKGPNIALCVFDVDKFKDINDTLGHAAGDEVIKAVASSMKALKDRTPGLIISRLGGDEFVLCLPHVSDTFDVPHFFDAAFRTICRAYAIGDKTVEVRCSGGVIVVPKTGFNLDDAMNKADLALYRVKQEKRDRKDTGLRWALFDRELEQVYRNTQQMRAELQEAVKRGQMVVEYQPMCTPDGKKIVMCEALCRWHHPELGVLGPDNFIGIAESMNLIGDITRHMIKTACRDCATWDDETCVSVNLSVLDLAQFEIVDVISDALLVAELPAERLQIEITESIFLKESDKARHILTTLKNMGVKTAMDDFGTGYANLSTINDLPLDKVKIDRSFIQKITTDEKPRKLFEAVVSLGKNMGLEIVVEGVETIEQLEQINRTGVHLIQGYLFGKPMRSAQVAKAIKSKGTAANSNVIQMVGRGSH